jgi:hypothetical protein
VAIVTPSGAKARLRIAASPTPRTRFAGVGPRGGPKIGSQGKRINARRSRPIHLRLAQGNREIPIRDRIGPSSPAPGMGLKSIAARRGGD